MMLFSRRYSKIYGLFFLTCSTFLVLIFNGIVNIYLLMQHLKTGVYYMTGIPVGDIYLYSVVANPMTDWNNVSSVVVNVWDGTQNKQFKCCLFYSNSFEMYITTKAHIKNDFGAGPTLIARQYKCDVWGSLQNITHVGLIESSRSCSSSMPKLPLTIAKGEHNKIAICAKIAYGTLSPQRLIEWFEYQRLMGVDKVLVMVQDLNEDALKVLQYYKQLNLLDIDTFPSPLPGNVPGFPDRGFEEHRFVLPQCSHDKQVGVYHCQEKLQGYDYVSVLDLDEYIVHKDLLPYKELLEKELLPQYPDAAGFTFNVSFFILDWGETGSGDLYMTRFVQRTEPRFECYKNIYLPKRVKEVTTHTFTVKSDFKRYVLSHHNVVIHHYRECPKVAHWKNCMKEPRTTDLTMHNIKNIMEDRVRQVKKVLKIEG